MADDAEDVFRRFGYGDPRWVETPADLRDPSLHPTAVNQFALPPPEPRAELRNPAPRPDAYVDKNTREYVMGPGLFGLTMLAPAFATGQTAGRAYNDLAAGDYKAAAPSLAELLVGMAPIPGMKKGSMPPRVEKPIKAYHGSPHDFDKFDLSKIGTGEGAQAFGHGLYMAENEAVARQYRDQLSDYNWKDPADAARGYLTQLGGDRQAAIQAAKSQVDLPSTTPAERQAIAKAIKLLESGADVPTGHPGKMYEVAIHATPDQFLDWDKPLSQQSEAVRKAFSYSGGDAAQQRARMNELLSQSGGMTRADADEFARLSAAADQINPKGSSAFRAMEGNDPAHATNALREAGIPGIRYLDQGSRGSGQGTSNYVVFDPNLIEILRKYGIAGPVAGITTADILRQYYGDDHE